MLPVVKFWITLKAFPPLIMKRQMFKRSDVRYLKNKVNDVVCYKKHVKFIDWKMILLLFL